MQTPVSSHPPKTDSKANKKIIIIPGNETPKKKKKESGKKKREKQTDTLKGSGWDEGIPVIDPKWGTGQRTGRRKRDEVERERERKCSH